MIAPTREAPTGLLLIDKPQGITSHDVVGRVRAILGTRRVGHAGTLDPMATGLLIVAVGRATKLLGHLALAGKGYVATIRLGESTDTDDADGTTTETVDATEVAQHAITAGMTQLTGEIDQVPSSYSAIKVDGRRAYDLARSGQQVALAARAITVHRFEQVRSERRANGVIDVDVIVECTTGTYVRALARDLGAHLGVGGHLTALRRTGIGPFTVNDAVDAFPDGITPRGMPRPPISDQLRARVADAVIPVSKAARVAFACRDVDESAAVDVRHGRPIAAVGTAGTYAVFDPADELLALVTESSGQAKPVFVWQGA